MAFSGMGNPALGFAVKALPILVTQMTNENAIRLIIAVEQFVELRFVDQDIIHE